MIYRATAFEALGNRQEAIRTAGEFLFNQYDQEVLICICRLVLGGGAAYGELHILQRYFITYKDFLQGDDLLRFRAETNYHLGSRSQALEEMQLLPAGTVPDHYFKDPVKKDLTLTKFINAVYIEDLKTVDLCFENICQNISPGTTGDMHSIIVMGRLERNLRIRDRLKNCVITKLKEQRLTQIHPD